MTCGVCGKPIPPKRAAYAAARGRVARFDSDRCYRKDANRRYREARKKANGTSEEVPLPTVANPPLDRKDI